MGVPSPDVAVTMLVVDLARLLRRRLEVELTRVDTGLTAGEARTLFYVWRNPGERQAMLADRMYVEPMTLVGYLDSLEKAGLIRRRPDPNDKRAKLIELLPKADPLLERINAALQSAFGTSDAAVKLTLTAYFLGFALAQLVCGPVTDAFGRKPVTLAFLTLYLVSSILATFAPTVEFMVFARGLQGVGAAVGIAVARAIVRDQFTGQDSARIMNTVAMMLALGPAVSPTIGGFVLELFGWREVFWCMIIYGASLMAAVAVFQVETNPNPGIHHLKPAQLALNYLTLLKDPRFLAPSLLIGCGLGNLYALATVLPFVLIYDVGLSPSQFGLTMIIQSGSFIAGTILTGRLLKVVDAKRLVPFGMAFWVVASALMCGLTLTMQPTILTVMGPVALFVFGLALVLPASFTDSLAPFPNIAGAASSMVGFLQFGGGIVASLIVAALHDPLLGLAIVLPIMPIVGIACNLFFKNQTLQTAAAENVVVETALSHARQMIAEGADILDVGGESTRPGSDPVSLEVEWSRLEPVLDQVIAMGTPVSIDTYKAEIARRACAAGAVIVNDVWGLQKDPAMAETVAEAGVHVVMMHNRDTADAGIDILADIDRFFDNSMQLAARAGIPKEKQILDPGFGFGKTIDQNFTILNRFEDLKKHGLPLLAGASRKRMIGAVLDAEVEDRLFGSMADDFVNICVVVDTTLSPQDLLKRCLGVEKELGRVRDVRWGPRVIDVDVLICGNKTISEPDLEVPHPRMGERAFVLIPLAEIWPDAPLADGRTAAAALATCPDQEGVVRLES
eukprot:g2520.t1